MEEDDARAEGLFQVIGTDFDDRYVAKLKEQSIHPEIIKDAAKDMKIVYTPLHGTGNVPVRRVLRELGFNQVYVVKEQKVPDGNFPTVAYPNPEDEKAWTLALKLDKGSRRLTSSLQPTLMQIVSAFMQKTARPAST